MDINTYSELALRTLNDMGETGLNLAHMALGITGEAGETADIVKKHFAYGKPLDTVHLAEEVGDIVFYLNGLLSMINVKWEDILEANIKKLEARYPDLRFDPERANNRDLDAEAKAISEVL